MDTVLSVMCRGRVRDMFTNYADQLSLLALVPKFDKDLRTKWL